MKTGVLFQNTNSPEAQNQTVKISANHWFACISNKNTLNFSRIFLAEIGLLVKSLQQIVHEHTFAPAILLGG